MPRVAASECSDNRYRPAPIAMRPLRQKSSRIRGRATAVPQYGKAYRSSPELLAGTLLNAKLNSSKPINWGHAGGTGCDSTRSRISWDLLHPIAFTNFYNSIRLLNRQRFYPIFESDTRLAADFGADTSGRVLRGRPLGLPETPLRKRCSTKPAKQRCSPRSNRFPRGTLIAT
jgi:hypothetical protein